MNASRVLFAFLLLVALHASGPVGSPALAAVWGAGEPFAASDAYVIDGDTIRVRGETVRLANLDAPELPHRARCPAEARKALQARDRLAGLLRQHRARLALLRDRGRTTDRYGRTLGRVTVNGRDVADVLIGEGLARPWRGRSSRWC